MTAKHCSGSSSSSIFAKLVGFFEKAEDQLKNRQLEKQVNTTEYNYKFVQYYIYFIVTF